MDPLPAPDTLMTLWHLSGVKTVFAPKTSVSLQLIQEKFVEY